MKFELSHAVAILSRTPNVLMQFLSGLPKEWVHKNEGEKTWSAYDIVGHLIHGEKTDWLVRTKIILGTSKNKVFAPFDRFAQFENSVGKNLKSLLEEFAQLRKENLNKLKELNISEDDLEKKGMHPELGQVRLKELLAAWVTHDFGHIAQISRVIAKQYKNEVGPWTQYITILNR